MKSVEWYGLAWRTGVAAAIVLVCLSVLGTAAHAQSPPIRSEVDKTELKTGEVLTLTVTIAAEGGIAAAPTLPVITNVNIVGRSQRSQVMTVNGQTTTDLAYEYQLSPTVDGPLTIGAIKVTIDGTTYETDPITVEVHPGGSTRATQQPTTLPPAEVSTELSGQPYYVEAEVDNRSPYVGEQVHYIFRFYFAVPAGRPYYEKPDLTGFWAMEDSKPSLSSRMVAGRRYEIEEINKVLFPTIAGPRTIGPAVIAIPGGLTEPARRLSTMPVDLDVRPLPPGAPADFSGAVGRFSISGRTNSASGAVNEPLTITVNLTGEGNFDLLPDPAWPDMPGWRTFDAAPKTRREIDDGVVYGRRTYERTLVPREAGDFTIPPVRFTYFDPSKDSYVTISTDPIPVTVAKGTAAPLPPDADVDSVERLATDIRHIKPAPGSLAVASDPLHETGLYWAMAAIPAIVLAAAIGWRRMKTAASRTSPSDRAHRRARRMLRSARKAGSDPYEAAGEALAAYIGDKLGQPLSGLTHDALSRLLLSRGADPDLVDRVEACLNASEGGRFAPGNEGPESGAELVKETSVVLSGLEKQLE